MWDGKSEAKWKQKYWKRQVLLLLRLTFDNISYLYVVCLPRFVFHILKEQRILIKIHLFPAMFVIGFISFSIDSMKREKVVVETSIFLTPTQMYEQCKSPAFSNTSTTDHFYTRIEAPLTFDSLRTQRANDWLLSVPDSSFAYLVWYPECTPES